MKRKPQASAANIALGKRLQEVRLQKDITRMQLAKILKDTENKIIKYEQGALIPLPILEKIGEIFDEPIIKKTIRRISFLRKLEQETSTPQPELIVIYAQLFSENA